VRDNLFTHKYTSSHTSRQSISSRGDYNNHLAQQGIWNACKPGGKHCNLEMEQASHSSSTRAAGLRSDLALNLERAHTTDSWIGGALNVRLFGSPGYFRAATCPPRRGADAVCYGEAEVVCLVLGKLNSVLVYLSSRSRAVCLLQSCLCTT
jgi:hypothetical protein